MALKATIYKAAVNIADLDRSFYYDANLTLAQYPSETEQRMMLRLLAWICHVDENLSFTNGLCADDEPEIWLRDDTLALKLWIELGLPDERRLKKACNQSSNVVLYVYSERAAHVWWQSMEQKLRPYRNLTVRFLDDRQLQALAAMAQCTMTLQATLQDRSVWLSDDKNNLEITFAEWQPAQ
ncbi:hypothetical protein CS369_03325 [Candidatus Symbiopectobacterium sp. 'North America']|uniref:YaeQ family protein n=1 Tax=Candidatus Symbiopectobacterium sp. 'North America' TaxID=2794574 RepID=UPI0018CB81D4|nr:YaeQ family protein [Candidatus Symbiopectobacterium sp. 'North America']MBG6244102.1 hypothetical protein [Candidatus Symbiopectobacterium sp. 'North America']